MYGKKICNQNWKGSSRISQIATLLLNYLWNVESTKRLRFNAVKLSLAERNIDPSKLPI